MILGISYMELASLIFFVLIAILLLVNIFTINQLKEDKAKLEDNEVLLTKLLGQIQSYFSKIDANISSVADEEQQIHDMFESHQKDEDVILKTLELNQSLFLDRMDRIVNIQQSLSDKIGALNTGSDSLISPEMIKAANIFMAVQKRDIGSLKNRVENMSSIFGSLNQKLNDAANSQNSNLLSSSGTTPETLIQALQYIQEDIHTLKELSSNRRKDFNESNRGLDEAITNVEALSSHIEIAKRNIQNVIEQSIDLNPIYKSVHELIEQIKIIFNDYHLAKDEIQSLLINLQEHENRDLIELKHEVNHFLEDIKKDMKESVEMLKKEYHLGQTQVTGTVRTLSDRSQATSAYQEQSKE